MKFYCSKSSQLDVNLCLTVTLYIVLVDVGIMIWLSVLSEIHGAVDSGVMETTCMLITTPQHRIHMKRFNICHEWAFPASCHSNMAWYVALVYRSTPLSLFTRCRRLHSQVRNVHIHADLCLLNTRSQHPPQCRHNRFLQVTPFSVNVHIVTSASRKGDQSKCEGRRRMDCKGERHRMSTRRDGRGVIVYCFSYSCRENTSVYLQSYFLQLYFERHSQ